MSATAIILSLIAGLAAGAGAAWLALKGKADQAAERARAEAAGETAALNERLEGRRRELEQLQANFEKQDAELRALRAKELEDSQARRELETRLENEKKAGAEKLALLQQAETKLSDAFKALSAEALKSNNQSFLDLAKSALEKFQEGARGDLEKRQQAINELVKPVRESLDKVDNKIQAMEKAREGAYESIKEQVRSLIASQKDLREEAGNLAKALRSPTVRGQWGEIQLKRVVEMAGMLDHCDFYQQAHVESEEGRLRPDLLVRLPSNKTIVVDSKAPLSAYLEAMEASDDAQRARKLDDHAAHIRKHITALSKKSYWDQFESAPEFVVLFLPGENFFSAALERDPSLIEEGVKQNVILATPTTLIALLRAVAFGWRQERLAENARAISSLGRELHKRLADMAGHWARLGKSLGGAVESYNKAVGTLETRVLVSGRKFKELDAAPESEEIAELPPVEQAPRPIQAPELALLEDGEED